MAEESSRVEVGRTAADGDGESAGEGEEYDEVEDMMCVGVIRIVMDWEDRLESGGGATFVRR